MADQDSGEGFPFSRDSKDYQQGIALMRKVLGDGDAGKVEGLLDHPLFGDYIGWMFSKTWGALYARTELSVRERSLVLMGTDMALGREGPLKDHIRGAMFGGLTDEQVMEALFQAGIYVGVPSLPMAMRVMGEVMAEREQKQTAAVARPHTSERMKMSDLGVRLGPINHVAMAVKDWKSAAQGYASMMGLKTWRIMDISSDMMTSAEYYGEKAEFRWISAFAMQGNTLLELCQPVSGKTVFADFVDQHGDGMQHVGDLSHQNPEELVKQYTNNGVKVGNYCNIGGMIELHYLDTRDQLGGMFLEVVTPATYAQIADMGEDFTFE